MLTPAQVGSRLTTLREASEADGEELDVQDTTRGRSRYVRIRIVLPGYGAHDATLDYEEWYDRVRGGWRLTAYQYELRFEPAPRARWAEHWHDGEFHRHCERADEPGASHYPGRPVQLFDARADLRRRYALGRDALRCSDPDRVTPSSDRP